MIFQQFEDPGLAQYSYALGCPGAGAIAVVDPCRTVQRYLDYAEAHGVRITHVLETHIHADFASGARQLAHRTGAELWLSAHDQGELYETAFEHRAMRDGDGFELGTVKVAALHTPGHTPEHLSFLVHDGARSGDVPMMMLSGDFLFVGSLGRPDLLGEDSKRGLAEQLFDSSREKLAGLPDGLEIHPGHGAGSMCGSGLGGRPLSTLGFERIANPYLDPSLTKRQFVERILTDVPPLPQYYPKMKALNSLGPPILDELPGVRPLPVDEFRALADDGHVVVDLREKAEFSRSHIPGSIGIGAGRLFGQWSAWALPYDKPLLLIAPDEGSVREAAGALVRVGLDNVRGYLEGGIDAWGAAGHELREVPTITAAELARRLDGGEKIDLLDVRTPNEWKSGRIAGATHAPAGDLASHLDRVPRVGGELVVICGTGYRSTVALGILEQAGIENLVNVVDGMTGWNASGLPVVTG